LPWLRQVLQEPKLRLTFDEEFVDFLIGTVLFWFVGFGIMFGAGDFMGMPNLFSTDFYASSNIPTEAFLIFQTVFCATAATIVLVQWLKEPSSLCISLTRLSLAQSYIQFRVTGLGVVVG
jgi:hypothetical protein